MWYMTPTEYHSRFFSDDTSWKQLAYRTYAISRLEGVFGCPNRPSNDVLEKLETVKVLTYYVLLGLDTSKVWHEMAISRDKELLTFWKDLHCADVIAKD